MIHNGKYSKFKSVRIENGIQKFKIVDICGEVMNDNPTEEELKDIEQYVSFRTRDINKWPEREYLLEFIRAFYRKDGRVPKYRDFNRNPKYPSFNTYIKVFGSWTNAIREAGLTSNKKHLNDEDLLKFLIQFYEENGRPPIALDFDKNLKYSNFKTFVNRFGSWQNALKIVGLDIDSMVRKGYVETSDQKGRLGEIFVLCHFEKIEAIDLSGENKNSPCDGECPQGYNYDVKTSYFIKDRLCWLFHLDNFNIDQIEWFYLLAFNEDFTKLLYAWRISAWDLMKDIDKGYILIGANKNYRNNIENLKIYDITVKINRVYEKWRSNLRKWSKEEILADARPKLKVYVDSKKSDKNYDKKITTDS